jgi:hypothetical protein
MAVRERRTFSNPFEEIEQPALPVQTFGPAPPPSQEIVPETIRQRVVSPFLWDPLGLAEQPTEEQAPPPLQTDQGATIQPQELPAEAAAVAPAIAQVTSELVAGGPIADSTAIPITSVVPTELTLPEPELAGAQPEQSPIDLAGGGDLNPMPLLQPGTSAQVEVELPGPDGQFVRTTLGYEVSPRQLTEGLQGTYTATVTIENAAGFGGELPIGQGSVEGEVSTGTTLTYEVTLPEGQHTGPVPNPYDPNSIPPGGSVMMRSDVFASTSLGGAFHYLQGETSHTESSGMALSVERPADNPNTVRVTMGPVDTVENSLRIGLGLGPVSASVGVDKSLEDSSAQVIDFDLSTPAGQQAYQTFMTTGQIDPALTQAEQGQTPVVQQGTMEAINYTHSLGAELQIGGLTLGGSSESSWSVSVTTIGDRTEQQVYIQNGNDVIMRQPVGPDGEPIPEEATVTIMMQGIDPAYADMVRDAMTGGPQEEGFNNTVDMQINLDAERMQELQQRAEFWMGVWYEGGVGQDQVLTGTDRIFEQLANAETPADFAILFGNTNGHVLCEAMLQLQMSSPGPDGVDAGIVELFPPPTNGQAPEILYREHG